MSLCPVIEDPCDDLRAHDAKDCLCSCGQKLATHPALPKPGKKSQSAINSVESPFRWTKGAVDPRPSAQ